MLNIEFEIEYDNALKLWDEAFCELNEYEKSITVEFNGTHSMTLNEKYSELLDCENMLHDKLNEARKKFFGLKETGTPDT